MTSNIHCDSLWHGVDIVTMRGDLVFGGKRSCRFN